MTYSVIAERWSYEAGRPMKEVVGQFDDQNNAELFARAYERYYEVEAEVVKAER